MRSESASEAKRGQVSRNGKPYPDANSQAGKVLSYFQSLRGLPIDLPLRKIFIEAGVFGVRAEQLYVTIGRLTDFYGMDIRKLRYKSWVLAGEWIGSKYIDFIAERLEQK